MYNIFVRFFYLAMRLAAPFHIKAGRWIEGRVDWRKKVRAIGVEKRDSIWIHAASLGEYEMARPLIDLLQKSVPEQKIIVSFFSPSGYDNAVLAEGVEKFYLPLDTRTNAKFCIRHLRPGAIIFVKYDLWFNLIDIAARSGVGLYLINYHPSRSKLRKPIFGYLLRRALQKFNRIYTLNEDGYSLLSAVEGLKLSQGSDTRFKNVLNRSKKDLADEKISSFAANFHKVVVCGSIWKSDWEIIEPVVDQFSDIGWIVAPHEVESQKVRVTLGGWKPHFISYTRDDLRVDSTKKNVLVLDCIGKLATSYRHGLAAYVGGGFGPGLHNILEPAAYGLPVSFGPNHSRFPEAKQFIGHQIGCEIDSPEKFSAFLKEADIGKTYKSPEEIIIQMKIWSDRSDKMLRELVEIFSNKKVSKDEVNK